jgi:membrane protein DedA with SNARE-associated domain
MPLFSAVMGLILGGFIWFMVAVVLEEPVLKRMQEKKFGKESTQRLSKEEEKSGFYIPLAIVSGLLGLIIAYLGSQGKL